MWILILVRLETLLVSVQDRCMVCDKRTIASEIILDAPDGPSRCKAQLEAHFGPFGDSANLEAT
jgi:hypothetical protein